MKMKRKKILICLAVCALAINSIALGLFFKGSNSDEKTVQPQAIYIIKSFGGNVAYFENNSNEPSEVFETGVNSLPKEEQDKLNKGIEVYDEYELFSLIESYTS